MFWSFWMILVPLMYFQNHFAIVSGLKCYECMSSSATSPCIQKGNIGECDRKYCTIYRQELVDPAGYLVNFYRACQDKPMYLNTIITTPQHKNYYRSCSTDLCNIGDGIDNYTATNINVNNNNLSSSNITIVPGMGSFASQLLASYYIIFLLVLSF